MIVEHTHLSWTAPTDCDLITYNTYTSFSLILFLILGKGQNIGKVRSLDASVARGLTSHPNATSTILSVHRAPG